jgi:hypothetical protein
VNAKSRPAWLSCRAASTPAGSAWASAIPTWLMSAATWLLAQATPQSRGRVSGNLTLGCWCPKSAHCTCYCDLVLDAAGLNRVRVGAATQPALSGAPQTSQAVPAPRNAQQHPHSDQGL